MPTTDYRNSKNEKLSGVTTIVSSNCGWSQNPLMYWAWDQGMHGKDYRKVSEEAANAGTIAHAMIEADLKETKFDESLFIVPKEILSKAESCFLNYLEWKERNKVAKYEIEPHLVSEVHQYGGTPDYIGYINGKLSLLDWKSGSLYESHLIQISAYKVLWEENHPLLPLDGGFNLIRFDKENAAFDHKYRQSLPEAWEAFLHLLQLHNLHKKIKKLL